MTNPMVQQLNAKVKLKLPFEEQKKVKPFVDYLIHLEKKYYDSTLKPFAVHEQEMQLKAEEYFTERYNLLVLGQKVLQEQIGLSWDFMDRAYGIARSLYAERKYEDSLASFYFLRFLNPAVFEYWFGEACLLQELCKYEQAASIYNLSLTMQPNNPLVYFQIANCYAELGDKESSLQALDFCIDYAKKDEGHQILRERAEEIKQTLQA